MLQVSYVPVVKKKKKRFVIPKKKEKSGVSKCSMQKYSTCSQSEGRKIAEGALPRLCAGDIARRRTPSDVADDP